MSPPFGAVSSQKNNAVERDRLLLVSNNILGVIPWASLRLESRSKESPVSPRCYAALSIRRLSFSGENWPIVHERVETSPAIGWFTALLRRSRWWFFVPWLAYELVRAGFYGGGTGHATTQIVGLLIIEIVAFVALAMLRPFESTRNNRLMTYGLGISKICTLALCVAFHP